MNRVCTRFSWLLTLVVLHYGRVVLSHTEEFSTSVRQHRTNLRSRRDEGNFPIVNKHVMDEDIYGTLDQHRRLGSIDEILRISFDLNERISRTRDPDCRTHKKLIFTPSNGIGNRLLAVVSAVMLAMMSDRIFELNWKTTRDCGYSYHQLFHPLKKK